jgi:hypothetical protein
MRIAGVISTLLLALISAAMQATPGIQNADLAGALWAATVVFFVLFVVILMSWPAERFWRRRNADTMAKNDQPTLPTPPVPSGPQISGDIHVTNTTARDIGHRILNLGEQPRRLTAGAMDRCVQRLSAYRGTEADLGPLAGVPDALRFAEDLRAMLNRAGWNVGWSGGVNISSNVPLGLTGVVINEFLVRDRAPFDALIECLHACGHRAGYVSGGSTIQIVVGSKD